MSNSTIENYFSIQIFRQLFYLPSHKKFLQQDKQLYVLILIFHFFVPLSGQIKNKQS